MGFRFSPGCECCGCGCDGFLNYVTVKYEGFSDAANCTGCDSVNGTFKINLQENVGGSCYVGSMQVGTSHCGDFPDLALQVSFLLNDGNGQFLVSINSVNRFIQKPFNCADLKGLVFDFPNTDARCITIAGTTKATIIDVG